MKIILFNLCHQYLTIIFKTISQNIQKMFQSIFYIDLTLTYTIPCAFFLVITITTHKSIFATKSVMLVLKEHQKTCQNGLLYIAFFIFKTTLRATLTYQNLLIQLISLQCSLFYQLIYDLSNRQYFFSNPLSQQFHLFHLGCKI